VKCLVTGAAGFIGSNLVDRLDEKAFYCDPRDKSMIHPENCCNFLKNSGKIEAVFHLGAISSTTVTDIIALTKQNILFSSELLTTCIEMNIPFVYASSASVYGLGKNGFSEDAPMTPINYYAVSKSVFDMYTLQKIQDNPAAHIIGLRYFNVYGRNESHKQDMASPVHKFINQAKSTKKINIFSGSENYIRDFVHVSDAVSITMSALNFNTSGIYNVGTGTKRSFLDVANIVSNLTKATIMEVPFPNHLRGKYQEFTCSDNEKINSIGHPSARISLEDGIQEVYSGS